MISDEQSRELALNFWTACEQTVANLYSRWQDEGPFENIADYKQPLLPLAARFEGVTIIGMVARPFGFKFKIGTKIYKVSMSKRTYTYKRIA